MKVPQPKRGELQRWLRRRTRELVENRARVDRAELRVELFYELPHRLMPHVEQLVSRFWVAETTSAFNALHLNMEGGRAGEEVTDPLQLTLAEWLEDPALRKAQAIGEDFRALEAAARYYHDNNKVGADFDIDMVIAELRKAANQ